MSIAGLLILLLTDVISLTLFTETLPRVLAVVTIATVAVVLVVVIGRLAFRRGPGT